MDLPKRKSTTTTNQSDPKVDVKPEIHVAAEVYRRKQRHHSESETCSSLPMMRTNNDIENGALDHLQSKFADWPRKKIFSRIYELERTFASTMWHPKKVVTHPHCVREKLIERVCELERALELVYTNQSPLAGNDQNKEMMTTSIKDSTKHDKENTERYENEIALLRRKLQRQASDHETFMEESRSEKERLLREKEIAENETTDAKSHLKEAEKDFQLKLKDVTEHQRKVQEEVDARTEQQLQARATIDRQKTRIYQLETHIETQRREMDSDDIFPLTPSLQRGINSYYHRVQDSYLELQASHQRELCEARAKQTKAEQQRDEAVKSLNEVQHSHSESQTSHRRELCEARVKQIIAEQQMDKAVEALNEEIISNMARAEADAERIELLEQRVHEQFERIMNLLEELGQASQAATVGQVIINQTFVNEAGAGIDHNDMESQVSSHSELHEARADDFIAEQQRDEASSEGMSSNMARTGTDARRNEPSEQRVRGQPQVVLNLFGEPGQASQPATVSQVIVHQTLTNNSVNEAGADADIDRNV